MFIIITSKLYIATITIQLVYLFKFIRFVEIRHLSTREDIVNVLQERFFHHLCVSEQEHRGRILHTGLVVQLPQIWWYMYM